jgi:hypothetical protein
VELRESGEFDLITWSDNRRAAFSPGVFKGIGDDALSQR